MTWKDVTLKQYVDLHTSISEDTDDLQKNIKMCSILYRMTEEELLNLSVTELADKIAGIQFLLNQYEAKMPKTEYTINGKKYTVKLDVTKMTTAQYIDFQNLYKDYIKNIKYIITCFLLPKGKKYGDGYDVLELADEIYDVISITDVSDIIFFFAIWLKAWTKAITIYSIKKVKKQIKREKNPELKKKMMEQLHLLQNEIEYAELIK